MTLNAYERTGDSTHLIIGMTLNAYKGKGGSAHLTSGTTLNAYKGKGDFTCLFKRGDSERLLL